VYNGDCGYITDITADYITILFDDSKYVNCDISNIDEIDLAYAISIHKSQGSQYKTVIIPMLMDYKIMLKRNLLYTAISRAKENVIIVGQSRAIAYAVHSNSISKRNTLLAEQINKYKGE
jgi:exodeoxyribonuclease V alpha subunit